jgi:PmbA protein
MRPVLDPGATLETLESALRSFDADELEIAVLARAGGYTRFAGSRIHQPQEITEVQYLVRAVAAGHPYRAGATTAAALPRAVRAACAGARTRASLAGRPGRVELAGPQPAGSAAGHWYDDTAAYDTAARTGLARQAMAAAEAAGGEAAGMLGRAVTQQFAVTSRGLRRAAAATEASGSLTVTIDDGTAHWTDLGRSAARLHVAESVADTVAQARASRGRQELAPGRYLVVLGAEAVGDLLQFLPALGFSGSLAAAGLGLTARAGEQLLPAWTDIADDAAADTGLPLDFDIEGVTKRRVPFFDRGRVGEPVTDLATAASLGRASTGHAHIAREQVPEPVAANIVMAPGAVSEAELIAAVARGVYLQRFWYTRLVDRVAGTITGVTRDACFRIENGRLTTPLEGLRFTESVTGVLARAEAAGREVRSQPVMNVWNGAVSAPALRTASFRLGPAPVEPVPEGGAR